MINAWTKPGWCNWVWPGSGRAVLDQMIKRGLYEEVTTEQTRWEGASYVTICRKGFADRGNNKYKDPEAAPCSASSRNWKSQESGDRRWPLKRSAGPRHVGSYRHRHGFTSNVSGTHHDGDVVSHWNNEIWTHSFVLLQRCWMEAQES